MIIYVEEESDVAKGGISSPFFYFGASAHVLVLEWHCLVKGLAMHYRGGNRNPHVLAYRLVLVVEAVVGA